MLYGFLLNKKAECESQIFFSRLEFIVETRCSSGVKTMGEHLQCISHNTGLISWVYQCWIGTLGSYLRDKRVVPTAVSVSPQQEKEGPFPMQYMRCAEFLFSTLSVIYHIFARASQVSFTRCWPRYCCSTGQETCLKQTDNSDWFHFYFTLTFRLHRCCKKKNFQHA